MKAYGKGRGTAALFLHCERWKEVRSYFPALASLLPPKKSRTQWVWNWMSYRAGIDVLEERKIPCHQLGFEPRTVQPCSDRTKPALRLSCCASLTSHILALISSIPSIVMISSVNTTLQQDTTDFAAFCATDHHCPSSSLAFLQPGDK